ncbi:MAG TPA: AMP-binding protein [Nakamurella sp.]
MPSPHAVDPPGDDTAADSPGPAVNVADLLRSAAARFGDRPAVIGAGTDGRTRTWSELDGAADAGAGRLRALGAGAGERVIIALPTGAELAAALFAVARAGLIAVPTGPGADVGALADRVGAVVSIGATRDQRLGISLGGADLADWWSARAERFESIGGGEDLAMLARARGDRAVMLSHRAIGAAVHAIGELGPVRLSDGDRVLQVLPLYHVAGWVVAFLPNALVGGAAVIPEVAFDVASVAVGVPGGTGRAGRPATESALRAAAEHAVTIIPGAPGFYHHLLAVEDAEDALASVRLFTSGNAPLNAADFAAVRSRFGRPVWEGYGVSESASVVTTSLSLPAPTHGSVGRPLPGIEVRILGPDGQDLAGSDGPESPAETITDDPDHELLDDAPDAGEVGRIVIRGSTLFSGYWPNGGGGPDAEGWFVTGDVGFLDDDGQLRLVDRAAEVIVVSGFTVYPREIEDVLVDHPDVAEVAVIGVPADDGHEELAAVLAAVDDRAPIDDELRELVGHRLPAFKHPAVYHLVDALPKTEVGRIDRDEVRRRFGPAARRSLPALVAVPDAAPAADVDRAEDAEPAPDVTPEPAGDLDELGARLPASGDRVERARDDTDEDLF